MLTLGEREDRHFLWRKSIMAWSYHCTHVLFLADWFIRADDDTVMLIDNLRTYLATLNPHEPHYLGRRLNVEGADFYSGGATNILSHEALKRLGDGIRDRAREVLHLSDTFAMTCKRIVVQQALASTWLSMPVAPVPLIACMHLQGDCHDAACGRRAALRHPGCAGAGAILRPGAGGRAAHHQGQGPRLLVRCAGKHAYGCLRDGIVLLAAKCALIFLLAGIGNTAFTHPRREPTAAAHAGWPLTTWHHRRSSPCWTCMS